jgi:hypothetical protein
MSSIMQPRFYENAYPIGRFVLARAVSLGLSRTDLVRRLRFAKLQTGHTTLTALMLTGSAPPIIAAHLAEALEVEQDLIDAVLIATARQQHDEARARLLEREGAHRATFRPHLRIETEREVPSPIFVAALIGTARLRIVRIPDATFAAGEEARDRTIQAVVVAHYRESGGRVSAFGRITEYVLVTLCGYDGADFGLPFTTGGNPAGPMREIKRLGEATLGTKRGDTRLTGLLKDAPIQVVPASHDRVGPSS